MSAVMSVNPFRCRMWEGHTRLEDHVGEATCREEIDSFLSNGQKIPVLARPLKDDPTHDFELIYGARRLFVARHLNVPLLLEPRNVSDREAVVALDIENRLRKDLSPYERGRSYATWLHNGLFASQDELARTLNLSASQVSRLIRLAQLPAVIVGAFPSPLEICETWGRNLMDQWEDPEKRPALSSTARAIAKESQQRPAAAVFQHLIAAPKTGREAAKIPPSDARDEVVKSPDGHPLFRVRQHRKDTALLLPSSVSSMTLSAIIREVTEILHHARPQVVDLNEGYADVLALDALRQAHARADNGEVHPA